jgi:hypothetical protein
MLKLIACLLMLIDHIGFYFAGSLPAELVVLMRAVGRLAFPIFAWLVARGYGRTRNQFIYFVRMSAFAVVSEGIIRSGHALIGLTMDWTNVLVTFALAIVVLSGYQLATHSFLDMIASLRPIPPTNNTVPTPPRYDVRINLGGIELDPRIGLPLGVLMMLLAAGATIWLKPDYGLYGIAAVLLFHIIQDRVDEKDQLKWSVQLFILLNALFVPVRVFLMHWPLDWAVLQCLSVLAIPLCYLYDKERRPAPALKYFFYLFYPLHMFLLSLLRYLL